MSSSDDEPQSVPVPTKKRRVQRACDACRLKKSDGVRLSDKKCSKCVEHGLSCTFSGAPTKRRSYIEALESRLELTEELLRKSSSQNTHSQAGQSSNSGGSRWSSDSPVAKHQSSPVDPSPRSTGVMLATLNIRSTNTPTPVLDNADSSDTLIDGFNMLSLSHVNNRFQGKSSGAMLVKTAVELRREYEGELDVPSVSRRMHYWTYNPLTHRLPHTGPFMFPDPDLLTNLVDLYFRHQNLYFPILHYPSTIRAISGELHLRNSSFAAVILLVCAIGSRFSDDPRVQSPGAEPLRRGFEFFDQLPLQLDHIFVTPTICHLQYYSLAAMFLEHTAPAACWTFVGLGVRLAQDVGVHRRTGPGNRRPSLESELWKRNFWVLVSFDRQVSMALGRSCASHFEEIDIDLPLEVDDEYMELEDEDPASAFVQPPGKPSLIVFFNFYLRLNNILGIGLKLLYSLNKIEKLLTHADKNWAESILAEMDSALNGWLDTLPPHLRWDANRREDAFFDQSALLYCTFYSVQIAVHRPFISVAYQGKSSSLPSLSICTNAARSCAHVADMSRLRRNDIPVPVLISPVFTSGVILLLNVWSGKRTGLPPHMNSAVNEVLKCMATMRVCERLYASPQLFDLLHELATIGRLPLPSQATAPMESSPSSNPNKRLREDTAAAGYSRSAALPILHPPLNNIHHPPPSKSTSPLSGLTSQQQRSNGSLPAYSADLTRQAVFNGWMVRPPVTSPSSWYPTQPPAPLGQPNFAVGGDGTLQNDENNNSTDLFVTSDAAALSDDVLAMWANAPTNSEIDGWGLYLNVMNELNDGVGSVLPQS
ncbi:Zn(2)-C6 fungal-type domain-containing protein, partial [Favolaschia claudopus]